MGGEGKGGGKSKGKGKGKAPPLPLPPPPSPGGGPGRGPSMRQLATEKVAAAQMKPGAIWTSSDTSAPVLPDSAAEIATLFGAKKTAKTKLAKTGLSNREEALVDKAQDVEIVLMKFKSKGGGGGGAEADIAMCDGVRDAILAFDSEAMDESYGFEPGTSMTLVRRLHGWYPDPRTLAQLAAYGGDMKRLLKADLFYKRLEETEGGVLMQQAMECFVICAEDRVGLQRVCSVVDSCHSACDEIFESEGLKVVFEQALKLSNAINESRKNGNAKGITVASMLKFKDVKTNITESVAEMTAMQYLAKQLCAEDPTWLLRFAAELADLSFAAGISFADVRNELHRLRGID